MPSAAVEAELSSSVCSSLRHSVIQSFSHLGIQSGSLAFGQFVSSSDGQLCAVAKASNPR